MKNTWVISDIHGECEKLINCFKKAHINKSDRIIGLGDYIDRGFNSYGVIEFLLSLKKDYECIWLRGNHCDYWKNSLLNGTIENGLMWKQGAKQTLESYRVVNQNPIIHLEFFEKLLPYYIDEDLNLYVHGGFNRHQFIELQEPEDIYWWDRDLVHSARSYSMMTEENQQYKFKITGCEKGKFKEIFVGHTPVQMLTPSPMLSNGKEGLLLNNQPLLTTPQQYANIWVCDTGAGKYQDGLVTIMNVQTKEFFQS